MLLKVGRHLRPREHFKLIVGREEGESRFLEGYRGRFTHLRTVSHSGPLALIDGEVNEDDVILAARLTARFSQGRDASSVSVEVNERNGISRRVDIVPLSSKEVPREWYL